jgi:hypothetical protein
LIVSLGLNEILKNILVVVHGIHAGSAVTKKCFGRDFKVNEKDDDADDSEQILMKTISNISSGNIIILVL